jgi:hypothetical protein
MSTPKNPIELIDRYINAVRFWLPKTQREEDVLAELGDDLRSQIEAKESDLKRPVTKEEVSEILKRCGMPMVVAGRLAPKRYLIGPTLFPIYAFVLKMVLLWIIVPVFIFVVGPATLATHQRELGTAIAMTAGNLWSALFIAAGVITLVFVVLERTAATAKGECKWDPFKLPPVRKEARRPSAFQTVCELTFNFFALIWLLLLPQNPYLVFGPAAAFLRPGPIWHTFYIPIVALAAFAILRCLIALAQPQWTWFPTLGNLLQNGFTLIILKFMLTAASHTPGGSWHPFVVIYQGVTSAESLKVSAIVNASVLLGMVGTWIGLCIAVPIQTWQFMRRLRDRASGTERAAALNVL